MPESRTTLVERRYRGKNGSSLLIAAMWKNSRSFKSNFRARGKMHFRIYCLMEGFLLMDFIQLILVREIVAGRQKKTVFELST